MVNETGLALVLTTPMASGRCDGASAVPLSSCGDHSDVCCDRFGCSAVNLCMHSSFTLSDLSRRSCQGCLRHLTVHGCECAAVSLCTALVACAGVITRQHQSPDLCEVCGPAQANACIPAILIHIGCPSRNCGSYCPLICWIEHTILRNQSEHSEVACSRFHRWPGCIHWVGLLSAAT